MEIKPQDLRIGNLLTNFLGETFEANGTTIANWDFPNEFGRPSPIKITEEWLLNFGAYNSNDLRLPNAPIYFLKHPNNKGSYICFFHSFSLGNIKYVHQLQNLYYALTQTELEIKI